MKNETSLIGMFHKMLLIRRIEEALAKMYKVEEQEIRCPIHLSVGQEAVAVGAVEELSVEDKVFSNHRAHAHYLAKGGDLKKMFAEFFGKETGCCGGRGGSMHLIDLGVGFCGAVPLVGSTIPLAVGSAWAQKLERLSTVSMTFLGDGSFEEGVVHEALNFSALHNLPVLFVCENNGYSVYTQLKERQPDRSIGKIAEAHGWTTSFGDGNDVEEVHSLTKRAVISARNGGGPQFLEFSTYRVLKHCGPEDDDHLGYRPPGELDQWKLRCPIDRTRKELIDNNIMDHETSERLEREIESLIDEAFEYARSSPAPAVESMTEHIYAG